MKYTILSIIKIISITFLLILFLEICLKFILFKDNAHYSCYEKVKDKRIYVNGKNCNFVDTHFESKEDVIYITDELGNRTQTDGEIKKWDKKIFFVGDSFTFGSLSNYEYTYPFSSVQKINEFSKIIYKEVNKGVNGYQISQVIENIKKDEEILSSNDLIIYGLTPNDLFDLKEEKTEINLDNSSVLDTNSNLMVFFTNYIKNSFVLKYFVSIIFKNDKIYNSIYLSRSQNGAGFIEDEVNNSWSNKYKIVEKLINDLPHKIKNRLIVLTIPQKIQINLIKKNEISKGTSFDWEILKICKNIKIKCIALTKEISQLKKTHYPLDGHMIPEANKLFGEILAEKILEANFINN